MSYCDFIIPAAATLYGVCFLIFAIDEYKNGVK